MKVMIDEVAKQAFALCDKYGINAPSHREMFVCGYRYGMRANSWHKVSEELPPVDTEVICKMKGVPFTEHFVCKWTGKYWLHWGCFGQGMEGWFGLNLGWEVVEWKEI